MNEKHIPNIDNIIDSVLYVRASGAIEDISADLASVPSKTIAQLIDEKKSENHQKENSQ